MEYVEILSAVEQLDGQLATIKHRRDPTREFLADIERCAQKDGIAYVYLYWVDRRTISAYAETLTKVRAEDILSLQKSGIPVEELSTAYLGDDWQTTLRDADVFPRSPEQPAQGDGP
jgi:hypothetical protein